MEFNIKLSNATDQLLLVMEPGAYHEDIKKEDDVLISVESNRDMSELIHIEYGYQVITITFDFRLADDPSHRILLKINNEVVYDYTI